MARRSILVLLAALLGLGVAQKVQFTSIGVVEFIPDAAAMVGAFGCRPAGCLEPTLSSPDVEIKVLRQSKRNRPVVQLNRTAWSGGAELELFARYQVDGNQSQPYASDWFPVERDPLDIVSATDPKTDISVEYQLRLRGDEPAGYYETTVSYSAGGVPASHSVVVILMPVVTLRVNGVTTGSSATVRFDYDASPLVFLDAVTRGVPLPITGGDLRTVEVYTNNPSGYTVTLSVGLAGSVGFPPGALQLQGEPVQGRVFRSPAATDGFERLLGAEEFSLVVDGSETPGSYSLLVNYRATAN